MLGVILVSHGQDHSVVTLVTLVSSLLGILWDSHVQSSLPIFACSEGPSPLACTSPVFSSVHLPVSPGLVHGCSLSMYTTYSGRLERTCPLHGVLSAFSICSTYLWRLILLPVRWPSSPHSPLRKCLQTDSQSGSRPPPLNRSHLLLAVANGLSYCVQFSSYFWPLPLVPFEWKLIMKRLVTKGSQGGAALTFFRVRSACNSRQMGSRVAECIVKRGCMCSSSQT